MNIHFFNTDINYSLCQPQAVRHWINSVVQKEHQVVEALNYIFCSDTYLYHLNNEYLSQEAWTDVLAFNYSDHAGKMIGDVYISIMRVQENAKIFQVSFQKELARIMVHGVLHLLGYKDHTLTFKRQMQHKEDQYLVTAPMEAFIPIDTKD